MQQTIESWISHSPDETRRWAARLAGHLEPGSTVALHGDLGAGKTCFVQGLAEGLGVQEPITSPTFTIIHEYTGRLPLYHVDAYRLSGTEEAVDLGLDDYIGGDGITVIEWAENVKELIPPRALRITFSTCEMPTDRHIESFREAMS